MAREKISLADAVKELAARDRRKEKSAIDPQELLAYHAGELSTEEREDLQDRLALDPQAAKLAHDLARFPAIEADDPGKALTEAGVAAGWQDLQARLQAGSGDSVHKAPLWLRPRVALALAAVLLLAVLGLGIRVRSLQHTLEELDGPRAHLALETLIPETSRLRQPDEPEIRRIELPRSARRWILVLSASEPDPKASYRLTINGPTPRLSWMVDGLHADSRGNVLVDLPVSRLEPGDYRLELQTDEDGEATLFRFHLVLAGTD